MYSRTREPGEYGGLPGVDSAGDVVMGMNLNHGGHLTHGSPVNQSGKLYHFVPYNVNENGFLDYDEIRAIARECKPKLIVAGASAYPREIRLICLPILRRRSALICL